MLNYASNVIQSERRDKLAIHLVIEDATPKIYEHTIDALTQHPEWYVLTYDKRNKSERRRAATAPLPLSTNKNYSRDEFPYACTLEGGIGASVRYVPVYEQEIQKVQLRFLAVTLLGKKDSTKFLVLPLPNTD